MTKPLGLIDNDDQIDLSLVRTGRDSHAPFVSREVGRCPAARGARQGELKHHRAQVVWRQLLLHAREIAQKMAHQMKATARNQKEHLERKLRMLRQDMECLAEEFEQLGGFSVQLVPN